MKDKIVPLLVIGALIAGVFLMFSGGEKRSSAGISVKVPTLSAAAATGQDIFKVNCSQCHGTSAEGTRQGPPLIHKYYEPNHHADGAFHRAATMGVQAHHWGFGNMPPIRTVTTQDVNKIISFIREVQKANGVF